MLETVYDGDKFKMLMGDTKNEQFDTVTII